MLPNFSIIRGVDFSGAKLAGRNIWVASLVPGRKRMRLHMVERLHDLAGTAERGPALAFLTNHILWTTNALWGMDFPFGLPRELFPPGANWASQFQFLNCWDDRAYDCGLEFVRRARGLCPDTSGTPHRTALHCRRLTDVESKAPFDTFHYRIIYQTFFGMRDVIGRLRLDPTTAVLPFQYPKLPTAERVIVECCPSSVLKRVGLSHQNYKQPGGGPLTPVRCRTRQRILDWLETEVIIPPLLRRRMMRNPGGDALDAVIAGVGAYKAVTVADHAAIRKHPRYRHEGRMYV
jgi:hypothetical protein